MDSSLGLIVFTTTCFKSGKSPSKYCLYILRIAGSGAYSPFLAVRGLNSPSLPFKVYQPQRSGLSSDLRKPFPPFRKEDTTPPGPKVSAKTLFTLPKGLTSPTVVAALPRKTCSPSYSNKSLKVESKFAEPCASSGTFQQAPASSKRIAPRRPSLGSMAYTASPKMRAALSGKASNTLAEFWNSSSIASPASSLTMQGSPFLPSASYGWTLMTTEPLNPPHNFCASKLSNISNKIFLYVSARGWPLNSFSQVSATF
mmetsp:Transcript_44637/g.129884  ORF Transcript_44637/g.129884 Transcript_44637/m.129884 type:complete len:256 (+) Transcript_44637:1958-2725(+)